MTVGLTDVRAGHGNMGIMYVLLRQFEIIVASVSHGRDAQHDIWLYKTWVIDFHKDVAA